MNILKVFFPLAIVLASLFTHAHDGEHDQKLNIYTYDSFTAEWGPGNVIKEGFEKECNCDVIYHSVDAASTLLSKLKLEDAATKADLVLGMDNFMLKDAESSGLFIPTSIKPENLTAVTNWHSDTFIPFDQGYIALVYHKNRVKNPPQSLAELVEEAHQDISYIMLDPRSSTPGLAFSAWVEQSFGDNSAQFWQKLAPQTVTTTPGWSEGYGLFLEGESDAVLSYLTSPSYHKIVESRDDIGAFVFAEHIRQIEVAAVVKYSKNQYLANAFIHYLLKPETQSVLAGGNWMFPVINGVTMPEGYALPPARALDYDAANTREVLINKWQQSFKR